MKLTQLREFMYVFHRVGASQSGINVINTQYLLEQSMHR